jgi:hypothetical protein
VHEVDNGVEASQPRYQFCRRLALLLISLFVAAASGCNERGSSPGSHESNLRLVAVLYNQYSSAHGGESPRSAHDFREFVDSLGPGVLDRAGFSGLDALLMSRRDGMPFAVKYQGEKWNLENAIAYEQRGIDGTRLVVTDLGAVSEISQEQFDRRSTGSQ